MFRKPIISLLDPQIHSLIFQQIEIDHYYISWNGVPVMRMFGITCTGNSVCCHVHGFLPYFYVKCPSDNFENNHLTNFKKCLNHLLLPEGNVTDTNIVMKESIYGYGNDKIRFIRITLTSPKLITKTRRLLEEGKVLGYIFETYEANIDFEIRFMVDTHLVGCSWVELPPQTWFFRDCHRSISRCQIEVDTNYKSLISHNPMENEEWAKIAPFRILSFDIECAGRRGIFPEAEKDPVIQIGNTVICQGEDNFLTQNIFTLKDCAPISGVQINSFENEKDMLEGWAQFVREVDPDIITGYNINNFDLPYLLNRANYLKSNKFPYLGRILNIKSIIKKSMLLESKQMGKRENKIINIEGRCQFDLLTILLRDYKLRSYTLNAVSYHFLQEQKEDVPYTAISELQSGNSQTRRRIAVYCMKDTVLPLRLLDKLMCIINYMEMARVTGVPISYLLSRGQQIKIISQLLRKTVDRDLVIPVIKIEENVGESNYEGATVIEPCRGYYDVPITILDFSSLYPSIMMAHNLCYTTVLFKTPSSFDNCIKTPSGDYFVKSSVKKGLLPEILESLLTARKKAKSDLKRETDPLRKKVLDGRQLALKIAANSVYGFTGAQYGKLPCIEISRSVTAFGREMIAFTKNKIEEKYISAKVIYGDTDSVMINFGVETVAEAISLGKEAAMCITETFTKPIKLEFEKVYFPYLLINKKRYAGLYFTQPNTYDKMDCKGIETVRRDNCSLVASLINTCLHKILVERNPVGAIDYAKKTISDLLCNRIDISKLIITKELTKTENEYSTKVAHVILAKKLKKRNPGNPPKLGDRIPYVIVPGTKNSPSYERAEDPLYVLENNLPIDFKYYLTNQLYNPLLRIFEPILGSNVSSQLLKGTHTYTKTISFSKVGPLAKFIQLKSVCIGCKVSGNTLCKICELQKDSIYLREINQLKLLEKTYSQLWTECQRCQRSIFQEIICNNTDCPIFYMRKKTQIELTKKKKNIDEAFGSPFDW